MGKTKKEKGRLRQARAKADPSGLAAASAALTAADTVATPAKRQQLIETLTSGTPSQKAIACHAIAHMVNNAAASSSASASSPFLHPQLLSRLLTLLFTPAFDARLAAAVALHSLTSLSQRACSALLKLELLPAAISLLPASAASMTALTPAQRYSLLVPVVGCIRDVTEQADSALAELSASPPAVQSLLSLLCDKAEGSEELRCEVGGLLLELTEDNDQLRALINTIPNSAPTFLSLLADSTAPPLLRCQLAGVVLNLQAPQQLAALAVSGASGGVQGVPAGVQEAVAAALAVLTSALQVDLSCVSRDILGGMKAERERFNDRLTQLDSTQQTAHDSAAADDMQTDESKQLDMADIDEQKQNHQPTTSGKAARAAHSKEPTANDMEKDAQRAMELLIARWHAQLQSTRLALELLTNLCAGEDEAAMDDDGGAAEEQKTESETNQLTWVGERLVAADSFATVMRLLSVRLSGEGEDERAAVASMVGEDYADECCAAVTALRCRAAALLTNFILYLPIPSFAPHVPALLHYSGQRLTQLLSPASSPATTTAAAAPASPAGQRSQEEESAENEMESLTGLYFVISKLSHSATATSASASPLFAPQHAQTLLTVLSQPSTPLPVQLNVIDILSLLATHAPQPSLPSSAFVVPVSAALLSLLASSPSVDVLDRCVNALMDVYAEDGVWGGELAQLGVLGAMQSALPSMERLVKAQRMDREDRRRYLESLSNVREFLKYKPQHV